MGSTSQLEKVLFRLEQDECGYPPVSVEGVWALRLANGNMRVDNIPFYVMGISAGDEIEVRSDGSELWFISMVAPSKNSTFRLIPMDVGDLQKVRMSVERLGCKTECHSSAGLIAVEVPANVPIQPFLSYLMDARESGLLDFEEAALRHPL